MEPADLIAVGLAAAGAARLATDEAGPAGVLAKARALVDDVPAFEDLVSCPYCLSVWLVAIFVFARRTAPGRLVVGMFAAWAVAAFVLDHRPSPER